MKRTGTIITLIVIVVVFAGALYYVYQKNKEEPVKYETEKPEKRTIKNKTVATGNMKPREEIEIKPNINGIIDTIYVKAGESVKVGDLIAKLNVVPEADNLNQSKNQITDAKIALDNEEKSFKRQKSLYEKGVISANDFDEAQRDYDQAKQTYKAAKETYDIIKTGTTAGMQDVANTNVRATVKGMVLDVPVEIGDQVIEANNFDEGTTIASLANVNNMIFDGKIDESEIGKIKEGLPLEIMVGAIEDRTFDASLYYIAPKAEGDDDDDSDEGAVQFQIKGKLKNRDSTFIRSGLSANASIILDEAEDVLSIPEALVQFDDKTHNPYVEIKTGDQEFERKDVKLGVSDGVNVEVKDGLSKNDKVKIWNPIEDKSDKRNG